MNSPHAPHPETNTSDPASLADGTGGRLVTEDTKDRVDAGPATDGHADLDGKTDTLAQVTFGGHSFGAAPDQPARTRDYLDRLRFPVHEWKFTEAYYSADDLGVTETLFAVGNGYLGLRGNVEEGRETHTHGTFINGFHETWPIRHAEEAFGFARVGQTIVNVPDTKTMKLYVDDEPMLLSVADLDSYDRTLDFRTGRLTREILWRTPGGKRVLVRSSRMVSFTQRHLAVMEMEITVLDEPAPVVVSSQVLNRQDGKDEYHVSSAAMGEGRDPRKANVFESRVLEPQSHWFGDSRIILGYRCANSKMTLAVGVDHVIETDNRYEQLIDADEDTGKMVFRVAAEPGVPIKISKLVSYHTSRGVPVRELVDRCRRTLDRTRDLGPVRCAGRGQPPTAAGDPLEPVPAGPGRGPGRTGRCSGQGRHRHRLRRALLLGHRDLCAAVPDLHHPVDGAQRDAVPLQPVGRRPPARRGSGRARCAVPVADDQRPRGVGLLCGRHGPVPHRRRHLLRAGQVRRRDR
jgi:hypothetical protein